MKTTKQKDITKETKLKVMERQNNRSISGEYLIGKDVEFHHVRPRSNSGVGFEWNIVAITSEEHRLYHDKKNILFRGKPRYSWQEFETLMKNHLKLNYPNWTYEKCKVQKYFEEKDYGIVATKRSDKKTIR